MSEGLRCRLTAIPGETPKGILSKPMTLPALLGNLEVEEEAQHSEYTTVSAGQFSQGAQGGTTARMLRSLSLEALTLTWDAAWLVEADVEESDVRGALFAILRSKKPVEMLVTLDEDVSADAELRMDVTFRSVRRVIRAKEVDTRYYTLTIKEWRDPSTKRRGSSKQGRKPGVRFPTTTKLKSASTLSSLAQEFYGRADYWRDIRDANGISKKFGQNTPLVSLSRFKVGSTIKLPRVTAPSSGKTNS